MQQVKLKEVQENVSLFHVLMWCMDKGEGESTGTVVRPPAVAWEGWMGEWVGMSKPENHGKYGPRTSLREEEVMAGGVIER